jgi:hypothetical protein
MEAEISWERLRKEAFRRAHEATSQNSPPTPRG